ncbi:MAG: class I SAM-dependent methyltransferase [bacterium]|nr:class I SAM-dependent methyltransferase [bacterium]
MTDDPPARLESLEDAADGRRFSPSAGRNREAIVAALVDLLPARGTCLEVAAGTGEHAVLAAERLPTWTWQPTDRDREALASIRAWVANANRPNLRPPVALELGQPWPYANESLDAVFASNVMHIAPIAATASLFREAAAHLKPGGVLLVYGPVFLPGEPRPAGNVAFDAELRAKDPSYGVRTLDELRELALDSRLTAPAVRRMPTNNVLLRFDRG